MNTSVLKTLTRLSITTLAQSDKVMETAKTLVAYYYWVLPFIAYITLLQDPVGLMMRQNFNPLWPLWWTSFFSLEYADIAITIRWLFLAGSLVGALWYKNAAARFFVFLSVLQLHAFESSFGYPNHPWYALLFTSFIFVWLPQIWKEVSDPDVRRKFLLVIWWAQAFIMLVYTMSGFGKLLGLVYQLAVGQIHSLSPYAFAYQIADWLPRAQTPSLLGPYLIEHTYLAWPLYLISFFFQVFALWTMVRPSLQRLWAFEMVLFHIGTYVILGINFSPFMFVLILLFFNTPFALHTTWRDTVYDFPVFGPLIRKFTEAYRATLQRG